MKICSRCGASVDDKCKFCTNCGSPNLNVEQQPVPQPTTVVNQPVEPAPQVAPVPPVTPVEPVDYAQVTNANAYDNQQAVSAVNVQSGEATDNAVKKREYDNGNIPMGILGASLFALGGGVIYFLLYQAEIIAGITGFITFIIAYFGYQLFSKNNKKDSIVGLVTSIIAMVVVLTLAELFCLAFELTEINGRLTIFEAFERVPDLLENSEISGAVAEDLVFAYVFGALASLSRIIPIIKDRKQK